MHHRIIKHKIVKQGIDIAEKAKKQEEIAGVVMLQMYTTNPRLRARLRAYGPRLSLVSSLVF